MAVSRYSRRLHIQPVRKIDERHTDIFHQFKNFETIDTLAFKYYNDPGLEWIIMCANPQYFHSFEIPAGATIRIPFPLSSVFEQWGSNNED